MIQALGARADAPQPSEVRFTFDGDEVVCLKGQTVAAALWAQGRRSWRTTSQHGEPRGLFCGMGICFDCLVTIDGRPNLRACQTPAREGMAVQSQDGAGSWEVPA